MSDQTDDTLKQPDSGREIEQASNEAAERQMRLGVWLNGLLAGGPSLTEAVKPWREGLPLYDGAAESFAGNQDKDPEDNANSSEQYLEAAIRRLRHRREQSGQLLPEIDEEGRRKRLEEVVERAKAACRAGEEFTPMQIVLAARYVEGVVTLDDDRR